MKAVVLVGTLSSGLRPLTLTVPLPLLHFCNKPLLVHQLSALKDAGVTEVVLCINAKQLPKDWDETIKEVEDSLSIKVSCCQETDKLGTAGPLLKAESVITEGVSSDAPFFVVNSDVLCSYPLKDLLQLHMKHGKEGTLLVTRAEDPSKYGVVVVDERTGGVKHFVEKPKTFVSDLITAGVYVFSPSFFRRIPPCRQVSMNELLPAMASAQQLHSMLLTGYWMKLVDTKSFMEAVGPQLDICKYMSPGSLCKGGDGSFTTCGNVMIHPTATVAKGCVLGPSVVIGPNCIVHEGVRLKGTTLLEGVEVEAHSLVRDSLLGWRSRIGRWAYIADAVLGEDVVVADALLINGATVLPHKEVCESVRSAQIII